MNAILTAPTDKMPDAGPVDQPKPGGAPQPERDDVEYRRVPPRRTFRCRARYTNAGRRPPVMGLCPDDEDDRTEPIRQAVDSMAAHAAVVLACIVLAVVLVLADQLGFLS